VEKTLAYVRTKSTVETTTAKLQNRKVYRQQNYFSNPMQRLSV